MRKCQIDRCRQLIISISLVGILLTGTLVGLSSILPMFFSAREHVEQTALDSLQTRAEAINNLLASYEDIARQFTSRTEIRRRLEAYAEGNLSFEELAAYTRPRLQDPMRKLPDLLFMRRHGPDLEPIVSLGYNPGPDPERVEQPGISIISLPDSEDYLVQAVSAINNSEGLRIGTDLLLFSSKQLQELLGSDTSFSTQAHLAMVRLSADGQVQSFLGDSGELKTILPHPAIELATLKPRTLIKTRDKTNRLLLTPLQLKNWALIAWLPHSALYAKTNQQLLVTSGVVLTMMLLGLFLTRRTLSPLVARIVQQAQRLEESAAELRLSANVFEHAQEAIIITNAELNILRSNHASNEITGYSAEQLFNTRLDRLFDEASRRPEQIELILHTLNRDDAWQGEICYHHADGHLIPALQTISVMRDDQGRISHLIHIFNDITDAKENERRMQRLASQDSLTGLPNRAALNRHIQYQLQQARLRQQHCAVLFIDLDNFKPVNDNYGHVAGDLLLKAVARRLSSAIREEDSVGRIGGDEFLVVTGLLRQPENAGIIAAKLIEQLQQPFQIDQHSLNIGASIGIAYFPVHGGDAQTLIHAADQAMYRAKKQGHNSWTVAADPEAPKMTTR